MIEKKTPVLSMISNPSSDHLTGVINSSKGKEKEQKKYRDATATMRRCIAIPRFLPNYLRRVLQTPCIDAELYFGRVITNRYLSRY